MEEIIVGVQVGKITLSFKTDSTGSNVKKGLEMIRQFLRDNETLFRRYTGDISPLTSSDGIRTLSRHARHKGRAETSVVLQRIEDGLLPKTYFKNARTTGEVKSELKSQTGVDFTSRKVSQALGVLFRKGALSRVGSKGKFRYLQE